MEWTDYDNGYDDDPWIIRLVGPALFPTAHTAPGNRPVDSTSTHRVQRNRRTVKSGGVVCKPRHISG